MVIGSAMSTQIIQSDWTDIHSKYDTFFVDIVGVMYDGRSPYPEAVDFINSLDSRKNVIFISNNPRPSFLSIEKLKQFGITRPFKVITSGDLAQFELSKAEQQQFKYYHLGAHVNKDILKGISLPLTTKIEEADRVLLTLFAEENEDLGQYMVLIDKISQQKVPTFCANPDINAMYGKEMRYCAGYFADLIKQGGGIVHMWGKPNPQIFEFVQQQYPDIIIDKSTSIMIGDTLETDIQAANLFGIDSLLVLSGISGTHKTALLKSEVYSSNSSYTPTYVMDKLENIPH
jgi:HAD superfamily hydrolase (TIGR01459 family)